ncbi:hypothetical protein CMV_003691 [Castanea mollissima]|uniref:Secreted protein n=1 Tax=Castanea mollissima TaxID=60419 RepID=A0A8J4W2T8_9ROSI|nr:hypothetical protein CMV_003691 [Castanea mollissima]
MCCFLNVVHSLVLWCIVISLHSNENTSLMFSVICSLRTLVFWASLKCLPGVIVEVESQNIRAMKDSL